MQRKDTNFGMQTWECGWPITPMPYPHNWCFGTVLACPIIPVGQHCLLALQYANNELHIIVIFTVTIQYRYGLFGYQYAYKDQGSCRS